MTKTQLIENLKKKKVNKETKLDCLQCFVDNYPVQIDVILNTPLGSVKTGEKEWTSLKGFNIRKDELILNNLNENFNKLKNRIEDIENFNKNFK